MTFPTASTTGVPDGTPLTPYYGTLTITTPGTVIDGLDIRGDVVIKAANVTIQNCRITADAYYAVHIDKGLTGVTVQSCDIDGQGLTGTGIGGNGTFVGNDIRGVENGINLEGWAPATILDNYLHDFRGSSSAHFDGIQIFGESGGDGAMHHIEVGHNTIINDGSPIGVSAIFVANTFGPVDDVWIHDNYLSSPNNFPIYNLGTYTSSPVTNVTWEDNYVVRGYYGWEKIAADAYGHWPTMIDNTEVVTGLPPDQAPDDWGGVVTPPPPPPDTGSGYDVPDGYTLVLGTDGNDADLHGTADNDVIHGGKGDDAINGWNGADLLYGDEGRDTFQFTNPFSTRGDLVMDFVRGEDRIDVHMMDANPWKRGDQAFAFDGYKASGKEGHLWLTENVQTGVTEVHGLNNGNEISFGIEGLGLHLTASDFWL